MIHGKKGSVIAPYSGYDFTEPGYMAATKAIRNISAPNPFSVMIKRELWQQLKGFDLTFQSAYALLDFALSALQMQWRIVYVAPAIFTCTPSPQKDINHLTERTTFYRKWAHWLQQGDPYYNPNLKKNSTHYEIA